MRPSSASSTNAGRSGRGQRGQRTVDGRSGSRYVPPLRVDGSENGRDRIGVVDSGDDSHPATTMRTLQGIDGPDPHEEVGPAHAPGALGRDGNWAVSRGRGDDQCAKGVVRCEDAMESPQRQVGCGDERGETGDEVEGLERSCGRGALREGQCMWRWGRVRPTPESLCWW